MSYVCVIGDKDSHGGAINSGDTRTTVAGIPVARLGDTVTPDPKPGHKNKKLVSTATSMRTTAGGKPVVCSGGGVNCGAKVTNSNFRTSCV